MDCIHGHVENYINRIRNFQDNLILWMVTWNIALIGAAVAKLIKPNQVYLTAVAALGALFLNFNSALVYSRHRKQVDRILNKYPELKGIDSEDPNKSFNWNIMRCFFIFLNIFIVFLLCVSFYLTLTTSKTMPHGFENLIVGFSALLGFLIIVCFFCRSKELR